MPKSHLYNKPSAKYYQKKQKQKTKKALVKSSC